MIAVLYPVLALLVAGFIALMLPKRSRLASGLTALLGSLVALAAIAYLALYAAPGVSQFTWFSLGSYSFFLSFATYHLNMLLLLLVGIITPLIFLYSIGFMDVPSEQPRFYFEMCVFAAAMMLFAVAADFLTMFIAWEMLGITSYLLIGFWYHKRRAPSAARKAITTIIIGDISMLTAMLLLWNAYHTFGFYSIMQAPYSPVLSAAMALVLVAIFTKSAQFPFHEWLADAMEGPTPVSAFLHSSTMVKAGVFLAAVLLPLFASAHLLGVMLAFGMVSALIGASNALAERHIKRILAYSTIEDLGIMLVALGLHALLAAMLLFIVQAFYKALLFMGAGSIMRANRETSDIYDLYGSSKNRIAMTATLVGVLSIAGIAPFSGFFGKVAIDSAALSANIWVYALLSIIEFASSIYIFRWLFVPMRAPPKGEEQEFANRYARIPKTMLAAPSVLAVLVFIAVLAYSYLPQYLASATQVPLGTLAISTADAAVESAIVLIGAYVAFRMFRKARTSIPAEHMLSLRILYNSRAVNAFYLYAARFIEAGARYADGMESALYELVLAGGEGTVFIGSKIRRAVNGQPNVYLIAFVIGIMLLVAALVI